MTTTRRLAAILAADVAGYSRLIGADEERTLNRLRAIRAEIIDPVIAAHRGRLVKTTGDGLLAEFSSVVDALRCATEWQSRMADWNAAFDDRIEFRIGINVGDVVVENDDIFGDGVNVAARLEALADPGGICVSGRVQEDAAGRLDLTFDDLGEQTLKNITRTVRAYRAVLANAENTPIGTPIGATPTLALPDKPSIAILPFQNMTGDEDQEYFVDGMVEEITTAIARLPWLFVIARNSSFTYKGKTVDVKQVARELGVRYVLEGSVRKAGRRVRITGQLIDTATGAHIWADRFEGSLDDIFELQDQVASSVAGVIEPKLRQSEIDRVHRMPTTTLDAYDLYLRALAQFNTLNRDGYEQAIRLLTSALELDPSYSPAAALYGWCRMMQKVQGWIAATDDKVDDGVRWAKRAVQSGKDDADALMMAAMTIAVLGGDTQTAAAVTKRAVTVNPNSAKAWDGSGWANCFLGQWDLAVEAFERAIRLSPLDPLLYRFTCGLAFACLGAGRAEAAMRWADQSLAEQPRFAPSLRLKAVLCGLLGLIDEGRERLKELQEFVPQLTVNSFLEYSTFYPPEMRHTYVTGFRRLGLPEGGDDG
jgi:adenylate cyclase